MIEWIFNHWLCRKTKNLTQIPIFYMTFDYRKYKRYGKENSCTFHCLPKIANDEFIKRAKISNPNLLILGTYTRAKDKIKYKCTVCGNENESVAYSILQGHGCPKCGIRERAKNRTKTQEKFVNELKEINPNIEVIGEYKGNAINIKCKCKICNNKWSPRPYDLLQGKGCKKCADKLRGQKKRNTRCLCLHRGLILKPPPCTQNFSVCCWTTIVRIRFA